MIYVGFAERYQSDVDEIALLGERSGQNVDDETSRVGTQRLVVDADVDLLAVAH